MVAAAKLSADIMRAKECAQKPKKGSKKEAKKKQDDKDSSVTPGFGLGGDQPSPASSSKKATKRTVADIMPSSAASPAKKQIHKKAKATAKNDPPPNAIKRSSRSTDRTRSSPHDKRSASPADMDEKEDVNEYDLRAWFNTLCDTAGTPLAASLRKVYSLSMIRDLLKESGKLVLSQAAAATAAAPPIMLSSMPASSASSGIMASSLVRSNDPPSALISLPSSSLMYSHVPAASPSASSSSSFAAVISAAATFNPLGADD
jgi:hypothetical protein